MRMARFYGIFLFLFLVFSTEASAQDNVLVDIERLRMNELEVAGFRLDRQQSVADDRRRRLRRPMSVAERFLTIVPACFIGMSP